ncbi:MAG: pyrB [Sedimentibacter sp.]|nr:pyrB [Sedimentibacter sp.]
MLKGRSLIEPMDLSLEELDELLNLAGKIIENPAAYADVCKGKVLATLFYEPSTSNGIFFS